VIEGATVAKRRARIVAICMALPEVAMRDGEHIKFEVRGKTVAYYLNDHHGDGVVSIWVKAPPGEHTRLIKSEPARYFMPAYLGPRGWVGLRVDGKTIDWGEVERVVRDSYALTAPKRLAALV
jgi:phosphoribosylglycinamide formyltransferase-1